MTTCAAAEAMLRHTCLDWKGNQAEQDQETESPLAVLARQLGDTALRPRELPPPKLIEAEYADTAQRDEDDAPPPIADK